MGCLLKMLSDMLQKPSTTFSYPHMSQTKSQTRPHRFDPSGAMIRLQRIYNFLLFHAIILSSVVDIIGLYYPLLYYFWD